MNILPLPWELIEEIALQLAPQALLKFVLVNRWAYECFGDMNVGFWARYMRAHDLKKLKTKTNAASLAYHIRTKCSECLTHGSRTVYPFESGGLRLCRGCLYGGTINSHYLRDVSVSFAGLGASRMLPDCPT
jgi:hypothetical protein